VQSPDGSGIANSDDAGQFGKTLPAPGNNMLDCCQAQTHLYWPPLRTCNYPLCWARGCGRKIRGGRKRNERQAKEFSHRTGVV